MKMIYFPTTSGIPSLPFQKSLHLRFFLPKYIYFLCDVYCMTNPLPWTLILLLQFLVKRLVSLSSIPKPKRYILFALNKNAEFWFIGQEGKVKDVYSY